MPAPTHRLRAFTLIEMLVVMAVIALLAAILLNLNGLVQGKAAKTRALGEIHTLASGCDSYKADNGTYPQGPQQTPPSTTDKLDPRASGDPKLYQDASLYLYKQLSGDLDANGRNDPNAATPEPKGYLSDFFTPQRLQVSGGTAGSANYVLYIKDPYGNSYGYSTAGLLAEQTFRKDLATDPTTAARKTGKGYNPSFDIWSTSGKIATPTPGVAGDITSSWIKNW